MTDWDHYKHAYSGEWSAGNRRERLVADVLERVGRSVQVDGLGAGSTEFLSGRASAHGHGKADPDLFVVETDTYVEVTGTNVGWVRPDNAVRVRPDKFEAALATQEADHWIVHVLDGPALLRCIELTEQTCLEFRDQGESIDTRHDRNETYVEIDPDHDCVRPFRSLLARLCPGRDAFDAAIQSALNRWTTVADIEDGRRHSIALQLREDGSVDAHDSTARRLRLEDHTGDDVIVTISADSPLACDSWEDGAWYFFSDLEGEVSRGEPALRSTSQSDVAVLRGEYAP